MTYEDHGADVQWFDELAKICGEALQRERSGCIPRFSSTAKIDRNSANLRPEFLDRLAPHRTIRLPAVNEEHGRQTGTAFFVRQLRAVNGAKIMHIPA